jgi:hypothetical protein
MSAAIPVTYDIILLLYVTSHELMPCKSQQMQYVAKHINTK